MVAERLLPTRQFRQHLDITYSENTEVCTALLPPAYFLNALVDQTKLLRGICFHNELLSLIMPPEPKNLDRKPMALEAWLTNLCWILDLRNNLGLSQEELLRKELISVLAPEPRKRSDLSSLIPERCGITSTSDNLDNILKKRHGVTNVSSLWPPFRTPKQLPTDFRGLDHVLHSRHLHYLLFTQLSLFVYGDPLVTEESLAMIIHLIDRALDTPCRLPTNNRKACTQVFNETQEFPGSILPTSLNISNCGNSPMESMEQQEKPENLQQSQSSIQKSQSHDKVFTDDVIMDWDKGTFEEIIEDADSDRLDQIDYDYDDDDDDGGVGRDGGGGSSDDHEESDLTSDSRGYGKVRGRMCGYRSPHIWCRQPWSNSLTPLTSNSLYTSAMPPSVSRHNKFWDTSLINCPYEPRTSIQDNLNCWLMVSKCYMPNVSCAQIMLASLPNKENNDLNITMSTVPVLPNTELQSDSKNVILDSLISLLIKAHARLYWSRIVGSGEAIPKIAVAGSSFIEPNTTAVQQSNTSVIDSPMTVIMMTSGLNDDTNNLLLTGHNQANNWEEILHNFPKHSTSTSTSNFLAARCMSVLMPNEADNSNDRNIPSSNFNTAKFNPSVIASLPPELRYFASIKPAYCLPEERNQSTTGG
ncbi:unnamed protein product [Trichobilharzia regenti]|nr:unnamed protein product [Trichobilharzia regenti]